MGLTRREFVRRLSTSDANFREIVKQMLIARADNSRGWRARHLARTRDFLKAGLKSYAKINLYQLKDHRLTGRIPRLP